ncbi:hypothetical protein D3C72_2274570 [compost metagenome]
MVTTEAGAPRHFSEAIVVRLESRKARTAFATPTPPTMRAVRPTSVRNCEKRLTFSVSDGAARSLVRMDQPASGNVLLAASVIVARAAGSFSMIL